ncbi:hypothetical protein FRB94_011606 [Tulasnella sp. JGI-2019a]|nr:hypothetical protein FRB93_003263 [Tulasnella sp. JGI-2019a]KAG8992431.1 hypothetical protein FRB94_011606 [Tulasnella sp. JGI-2019a]
MLEPFLSNSKVPILFLLKKTFPDTDLVHSALGVGLYIYGASPAQLALIANNRYEHPHQEICIDDECEAIDTHQIYLNINASRAHEPVLLWSHEGYPFASLRHTRLRLLDKHSPFWHIKRMTFSKFVVSEVKQRS